jgi:lipoyl(octanoyl) transferase
MLSQALSDAVSKLIRADGRPVEWAVSEGYVPYEAAVAAMEARAAAIAAGEAPEMVWLLEHPPLYTAGVSSKAGDLLDAGRFPVHRTGRGGQFTYHGPGQRVAYVMLDLNQRGRDVRTFVRGLEQWLIGALGEFGVPADVRDGRVGVWVERSLNVEPDLAHFSGIVPCGISEHGVTSLVDLGVPATMDEADAALKTAFQSLFGATAPAAAPVTGPGRPS